MAANAPESGIVPVEGVDSEKKRSMATIRAELEKLHANSSEWKKELTMELVCDILVANRTIRRISEEIAPMAEQHVESALIPIRSAMGAIPESVRENLIAESAKSLKSEYMSANWAKLEALRSDVGARLVESSDFLTTTLRELNQEIRANSGAGVKASAGSAPMAKVSAESAPTESGRIPCPYCSKSFANASAQRQHIAQFHAEHFPDWKAVNMPGKAITEHERALMRMRA